MTLADLYGLADQAQCYIDQCRSWQIIDKSGGIIAFDKEPGMWKMHCGHMTARGTRIIISVGPQWIRFTLMAGDRMVSDAVYDDGQITLLEAYR